MNYNNAKNDELLFHPGCKLFKLKVLPEESKTTVWVYSTNKDYYHNPNNSLTNHVRGIQRDLVRETLKETKAFKYTNEAVKSASPSKLSCGNLQNIKSDDVIRKIRSEALSEDDYAREDFEDLLGMYRNENYIQHVGLPSYLHCYSEEQLELLMIIKSKAKGTVTGYLDATGTVARKINSCDKRILYYAVVVSASLPAESSVTCPIVEMVSSSHDIIAISQWLLAFKAFVLKKKQEWPVFTNVVTDFSYAQMHSLCLGWNGLSSIFDYLNWCFSVLYEHSDKMNMTIINVCANHYSKIIVNHVHSHFLKTCNVRDLKRMQNSIIDWICLLFNVDSMDEIEVWFKLFTIVFSSRTKTDHVINALNALQNKCTTLSNVECDESCLDEVNGVLCETQTSKSKMYNRFQKIRDSVMKDFGCDFNFDGEYNEYFNEDYLQQFILKCVPFIPLRTPVMNKKLNTGIKVRQSNATV